MIAQHEIAVVERAGAGWPAEVLPFIERAATCEYASLTRGKLPITFPVAPYLGDDGRTINVSTGLAYPSKAERARRDPRVALLFSDPTGSGLSRPPVVLVQGLATVRDANLQANADRYIAVSVAKFPAAFARTPRFMLNLLGWYLARIWVLVTPLRITWWPDGHLDSAPRRWEAPVGTVALPSDPAPAGRALPPWQDAPTDWRPRARQALTLGAPVLTTVGADGLPLPLRTHGAALAPGGFALDLPAGLPEAVGGRACLLFHTLTEEISGQVSIAFVGEVEARDDRATFRVERALGDFSLGGSALRRTWAMLDYQRRLKPRIALEAARRGQPTPTIRLP